MKKSSMVFGRKRKKSTTNRERQQTTSLRRTRMEKKLQEEEDISLFWCLEDPETRKKCQDFFENRSISLTEAIYHPETNRKSNLALGSPKKVKRTGSQTFLPDIGNRGEKNPPIDGENDEFGQILISLRQHIKALQKDDHIRQRVFDNPEPSSSKTGADSGATFSALNVIQCDLVKVKKFLTFKPVNEQQRNQSLDTFQIYNLNIMRILNDRHLLLQLLHLECIIFRHLKTFRESFGTQSQLCQDIILTQMQSFFRIYYSFLIKLSYEPAFSPVIRMLHPKSASVTAAILNVYLIMIQVKFSQMDSKKPAIRQELADLIVTNRSIVIMLDYIIGLSKINLLSLEETAPLPDSDQLDFDKMSEIVDQHFPEEDFKTVQLNLINAARLIFTYSVDNKFIEITSSVRSRMIIMLCSVGQKFQNTWDRFCSVKVLAPITLKLIENYVGIHTRICDGPLLNLQPADVVLLEKHEKPAEKEAGLKSYLHYLRDIYGLVTLLLIWVDFPLTNRYLRKISTHRQIVARFMNPLVRSLSGTEDDDPEALRQLPETIIKDRGEAYRIWGLYYRLYERIMQYFNRIIVVTSLITQRLLPPLVVPLDDFHNPFRFELSGSGGCRRQESQSSEEVDFDNDEDDFLNFPTAAVASDDEYGNDGSDEDDDGDESSNHNRNNEPATNGESAEQNELLARSYLSFFPEIQLFSKSHSNQDYPLSCSCQGDGHQNRSVQVKPDECREDDDLTEFLQQEFQRNNDVTQSVIPRTKIPEPERRCFEQDDSKDDVTDRLMTYPFLKRVIRYKNLFHIKLLDHVEERLAIHENEKKNPPEDILIYDVENSENHLDVPVGTLRFESRFECGNLRKVFRRQWKPENRQEQEYILLLNSDVNSSSHTQWFYFAISGAQSDQRYRFKIINFEKKSILYNRGQKPLFYSCRENRWKRFDNGMVASYRNHYVKNGAKLRGKPFYTVEFTFELPDQDEYYVAFNLPFSYTLLKTCISRWQKIVPKNLFFQSQTLCSTLRGNDMPVLTITSKNFDENISKHYIVVTGRVHPAESNSSWIAKGFVDFLVEKSPVDSEREQIRSRLLDRYIFKIIPMLNPDGVINGCTRTDLQAEDLNRHWADPSPILYPTIFHARLLVQCLHLMSKGRNPVAFLDLHGHSGRHNIFSYSCFPMLSWKKSDRQAFFKQTMIDHPCICDGKNECNFKQRVEILKNSDSTREYLIMPPFLTLPVALLGSNQLPCPTFDPDGCCFVMQREREQTARMVAWRHFRIPWTYTIECSAAGCSRGQYAGQTLSRGQMEETGGYLAQAFDFVDFVFCSQKHFPLIIHAKPEGDIQQDRKALHGCLMNKCIRNRTSFFKTNQDPSKHQKMKEMIHRLYPDFP